MFAQKADAFPSRIYNIDMYTSPSEWTIAKYSIPFEIIPGLIPSHFKGHLRHVFTTTHMNTFTFQKLPQMPVGLFSWTEYPHLIMCIYYSFPKKSSVNLRPRQNLLCINYPLKWALEGCPALTRSPLLAGAHWEGLSQAPRSPESWEIGLSGGSASRAIFGKFEFL